jgi:membrane protease YdiL (CAAX protease family)
VQAEVRRFWKSDAGALVMYFIGVVVLAAILMPWMYELGMWLARLAEAGEVSGVLKSIGKSAAGAAEKGKIGRFFTRSMTLAALLLMPVLLCRLRRGSKEGGLGLAGLPTSSRKLLHLGFGVTLSGGILWLSALGLAAAGAFAVKEGFEPIGLLTRALLPAVGAAIGEEWLFRGLVLGAWLRVQSTWRAIIGTSVLFAVLHFMSPLPGQKVADPGAALAGFELLGKIFLRFAEPRFFVAELLTLFILGVLLAWARVRTKSLWLPIGLHAGIVFAFKSFNMSHARLVDGPVSSWWVGMDLRAGVVPLASLLVMALILKGFLGWDKKLNTLKE